MLEKAFLVPKQGLKDCLGEQFCCSDIGGWGGKQTACFYGSAIRSRM